MPGLLAGVVNVILSLIPRPARFTAKERVTYVDAYLRPIIVLVNVLVAVLAQYVSSFCRWIGRIINPREVIDVLPRLAVMLPVSVTELYVVIPLLNVNTGTATGVGDAIAVADWPVPTALTALTQNVRFCVCDALGIWKR